jgi:hypothetical protein
LIVEEEVVVVVVLKGAYDLCKGECAKKKRKKGKVD